MRILQIIDSLDIGGAEKMAVNYANALSNKVAFSGLVTTRKEGSLKEQINSNVPYLFLNRKKTIDFSAIFKLKKYCKSNDIQYVQAHSSSFFTAFLLKLILFKIKIIWHDHNGLSEFLNARKSLALKIASYFFDGIIVVNYQLKNWAERELNCKKVIYLANFTSISQNGLKETALFGENEKRILCLANLRFQKNHFLLIDVAKKLKLSHPDWTFHLVGKDFNDDYSSKVKSGIAENDLQNHVFIYGSKNDTQNIIEQSEIAILTSQSEGLPVALLEYGLNKKAVVSTEVGEIPLIIVNNENGFIVSKFDAEQFYSALIAMIENRELRMKLGEALYKTIQQNNSEEAVLNKFLSWVKTK